MNVPNCLTSLRIVLAFVFLFLLWIRVPYNMLAAWIVFALAALTDVYDGRLARRYGAVTDFGKLMDPVADKMIICAAFISFVQLGATHVPAWMVVIIISREFIITGMRLLALGKGQVLAAGRWGKHKTVSQVAAIIIILTFLAIRDVAFGLGTGDRFNELFEAHFANFAWWLMLLTTALTVGSGLCYLSENRSLFREGRGRGGRPDAAGGGMP
ncbi:MAG: CDP-diacylglycerol--glycerol-3-phosphate 3-phosphatidyltransferase [bacterium]|nr:CDP-diacylglycerol--glycerol-3-phosphate 3-phosphatidyltransferase [bacterium]